MLNQENYERIEKAIRFIQANKIDQPKLDTISSHVGLSKFHFQKLFTDFAGISPKSFLQFISHEHAKALLLAGQTTLDAAYETGLSGNGRLHDLFVKISATSPASLKSKSAKIELSCSILQSPFGQMLAAETKFGLCHLRFFQDEKSAIEELKAEWPNAELIMQNGREAQKLEKLLTKNEAPERLLLDLRGTPFQLKVWEALLKIPNSQLLSYGNLASKIGNAAASRAVGSAIGKNPIAYIIPCHRVIKESAELGGYRWGTPRKAAMIAWESASKNLFS